MIRRVVLAGGLVAALFLSSCSAATDGDVVATVDGQQLTLGELEALLAPAKVSTQPSDASTAESAPTEPPTTVSEQTSAENTRAIIRQWILMAATGHDMSAITDAESLKKEAEAAAEELATPYLPDAEAAYAKGWDASPAVCLAAIFPAADVDAQVVVSELEAGTPFADAVEKYSQDATTKQTKGIVTLDLGNGQQPCYPTSSLNDSLAEPMKGALPGDLRIVQGPASQVIVLIRPFDQLTTGEKVSVVPDLSQKIGQEYSNRLADAKISVDPRYGRWDTATSSIVPLDA